MYFWITCPTCATAGSTSVNSNQEKCFSFKKKKKQQKAFGKVSTLGLVSNQEVHGLYCLFYCHNNHIFKNVLLLLMIWYVEKWQHNTLDIDWFWWVVCKSRYSQVKFIFAIYISLNNNNNTNNQHSAALYNQITHHL